MDLTYFQDNYIWIIIVAVIVVMTIVGYIADKTHFGENKEKSKKDKKKKGKNENLKQDMDDFMPFGQSNLDDSMNQPKNDNFDISMDNQEVSFDSFEPVAPTSKQIDVQTEQMNFDMSEQPVEVSQDGLAQENNVDDPTNIFEMPQTVSTEETTEPNNLESTTNGQIIQNEQSQEDDFNLPSIDKLNQEIADVEEDEDVWKF